jgi:hypothetical protein
MKTLATNLFLCFAVCVAAQSPNLFPAIPKPNEFAFAYPSFGVDVQAAVQKEYTRLTQWYETYNKGETDESGTIWSQPIASYQAAVLQLNAKGVENATYYDPENNRLLRFDYYYINGLLSAIDEFKFDKEQKEQLIFTDVYFYEADGRPAQRTRQFAKDKGLREMVTYRLDAENKLQKQKTEYSGKATKAQTISLIETGKQLISWEYGSTTRRSVFQNGNELIEMHEYQMQNNLPQTIRRYGRNYAVISESQCHYDGDKLQRISTQLSHAATISKDNPNFSPRIETFFFYNEEGLLERIIVEQGDLQEVFNYSYSQN